MKTLTESMQPFIPLDCVGVVQGGGRFRVVLSRKGIYVREEITKKIQEGRRHRETVVTFDAKTPSSTQMEDRDLNLPDLPPKRTRIPGSDPACRT